MDKHKFQVGQTVRVKAIEEIYKKDPHAYPVGFNGEMGSQSMRRICGRITKIGMRGGRPYYEISSSFWSWDQDWIEKYPMTLFDVLEQQNKRKGG